MSRTTQSPSANKRPEPARAVEYRQAVSDAVDEWLPTVVHVASAALESAALRNAVAADRAHYADVLTVLQARRAEFTDVLVRELRHEVLCAPAAPGAAASAPRRLELTLLDEDRIDEQIEVARIVQSIESRSEWELSHLAALCSQLEGRDAISNEANPLQPSAVARGMLRALEGFTMSRAARLLLLRELGTAAGAQLRTVYTAQAKRLEASGVQPLRFSVRAPSGAAGEGARRTAQSSTRARGVAPAQTKERPARAAPGRDSLARLVEWARQDVRLRPDPAGAPIRLLDETLPMGEAPPLDPATAVVVMERLFALLASQDSLSIHARGLMQQLDTPARRIAAHDPALWGSLKHPWWQLLDRVVSAGSVEEESGTSDAAALLDRVVERLAQAPQPDAERCRQALAEVDFVVSGLLDERSSAVDPAATALQRKVDRDAVERHVREQIVEQLRRTQAPAVLRQFLLGPWAIAIADAAVNHGEHSAELRQRSELVDALIHASDSGVAAHDVRAATLIERAREGLAAAGFPTSRIEAEIADLRSALQRPAPVEDENGGSMADMVPEDRVLGLHDGLTTVPVDSIGGEAQGAAEKDRQAWLDSLEPGDYCRLFLLERWMTTQLTWRSSNRGMFVFTSRHAGRLHSLTRRALEKLRAAGLAATIQNGQLVAQAMDTLTDTGS